MVLEGDHHAVAGALAHVAVQRFDVEALVLQRPLEPRRADLGAAEDDRLLRFFDLQQLDQAGRLLFRRHLDERLLDRVDRQGFRGDRDRHRVVHVALGELLDRRRHRRREERRLPAARAHAKDFLDVLDEAEVEHLVGLVEDDVARRGQHQRAAAHQVHHPPDRGDDDVGAGAQLRLLRADRGAAEDGDDLDVEVLGHRAQCLGHLDAELAGRRHHDRLDLVVLRIEVLQQRQAEGRRLAGAGLRLADHVVAAEQLRDRLLLDRSRVLVAELVERLLDRRIESEVFEGGHSEGSRRSLPLLWRDSSARWAAAASDRG